MRDHEEEMKAAGASIAAVGLGDLRYASGFREETGITFPLLVDADRLAYKAAELGSASLLHLARRDNNAARKRAQAAGHRQHGLGEHPFQLGGSLVFGPGDTELFVHVSETFGDNASPEDILAALR